MHASRYTPQQGLLSRSARKHMSMNKQGRNGKIEEEPKTVPKAIYEEKCVQFLSVQRNYETLSRSAQMKQTEFEQLRQQYEYGELVVSIGFALHCSIFSCQSSTP